MPEPTSARSPQENCSTSNDQKCNLDSTSLRNEVITINVNVRLYDYGELYNQETLKISGTRSDLAKLLQKLPSNACYQASFQTESGEWIDSKTINKWARGDV